MIPKRIVVAGRIYPISYGDLGQEKLGETRCVDRGIKLHTALPPDRQYETFVHEVVHATLYETGVANVLTDEQNEAVADAIALVFSDLFVPKGGKREVNKRNPKKG